MTTFKVHLPVSFYYFIIKTDDHLQREKDLQMPPGYTVANTLISIFAHPPALFL